MLVAVVSLTIKHVMWSVWHSKGATIKRHLAMWHM